MADFAVAIGNPQHQYEGQSPTADEQSHLLNEVDVEEAYGQFQSILMDTFGQVHMGKLPEASQSLRKLSGWLVNNSEELGMVFFFFLKVRFLLLSK